MRLASRLGWPGLVPVANRLARKVNRSAQSLEFPEMHIELREVSCLVGGKSRVFQSLPHYVIRDLLSRLAHEQVEPPPVIGMQRVRIGERREARKQGFGDIRLCVRPLLARTDEQPVPGSEGPVVDPEERLDEIAGHLFIDRTRGRLARPAACAQLHPDAVGLRLARDQPKTVFVMDALRREPETEHSRRVPPALSPTYSTMKRPLPVGLRRVMEAP